MVQTKETSKINYYKKIMDRCLKHCNVEIYHNKGLDKKSESIDFIFNKIKYKYINWKFYDIGRVNLLYTLESIYKIDEKKNLQELLEKNDLIELLKELKNERIQ